MRSIDKKRNSVTDVDTSNSNRKSQFLMDTIISENKDIQLNGEFVEDITITDEDCEKYMYVDIQSTWYFAYSSF